MDYLFPYDNIIAGILIFIVGFCFHWVGQLISILNWDLAIKLGLQESKMPPEYKVYEQAIAMADSLIGWAYGLAAIGLFLDTPWGYKLAWLPGVVLLYHSISFWFWTAYRNEAGHQLEPSTQRVVWTVINFLTGVLAMSVAWVGS